MKKVIMLILCIGGAVMSSVGGFMANEELKAKKKDDFDKRLSELEKKAGIETE